MRLAFILSAALAALPFRALCAESAAAGPLGKAIAVFGDRNTTKIVLETRQPLIPGRQIYLGPDRIAVTVGELLSKTEQLFYYGASVPGKSKVENGDEINLDGPRTEGTGTRSLSTPSALTLQIKEHYTFEQKRRGEVTAVQGDHAMIDRGSLHEVRDRDIYRIYDGNGRYKGLIELRGVGDMQSSGKLYNALEDFHRDALRTVPGDRVVFAGQRKLFGLGFVGGVKSKRNDVGDTHETNFGGGLLWNVTFPDGWGAEVLFGAYILDGKARMPSNSGLVVENIERRALFIAPIWAKKNFFYPSAISPFLAAGLSFFNGQNKYTYTNFAGGASTDETRKVSTVVPVLGAGIEFFPGRFFRPRFDVRYFAGPKITANGNVFYTESVFYSFGFLTTW